MTNKPVTYQMTTVRGATGIQLRSRHINGSDMNILSIETSDPKQSSNDENLELQTSDAQVYHD